MTQNALVFLFDKKSTHGKSRLDRNQSNYVLSSRDVNKKLSGKCKIRQTAGSRNVCFLGAEGSLETGALSKSIIHISSCEMWQKFNAIPIPVDKWVKGNRSVHRSPITCLR